MLCSIKTAHETLLPDCLGSLISSDSALAVVSLMLD